MLVIMGDSIPTYAMIASEFQKKGETPIIPGSSAFQFIEYDSDGKLSKY